MAEIGYWLRRAWCWLFGHVPNRNRDALRGAPDHVQQEWAAIVYQLTGSTHYCRRCGRSLDGDNQ